MNTSQIGDEERRNGGGGGVTHYFISYTPLSDGINLSTRHQTLQ